MFPNIPLNYPTFHTIWPNSNKLSSIYHPKLLNSYTGNRFFAISDSIFVVLILDETNSDI